MNNEECVQMLQEISYKKYVLVREILELTRAQAHEINEDRLERLEALVNEKQTRIDAVNKLDEDFDSNFLMLKRGLNINSLDELKGLRIEGMSDLKETIGCIMEAIKEINILEKQNNEKARDLLDRLGQEIRKVNQGRRISSAYMPKSALSPSYFIDKRK